MHVFARAGKIFIDWGQNDRNKSTVAPYSLRGVPWPIASAPVAWDEVERAATEDAAHLVIDISTLLDRIDRDGDLFAPVLSLEQELPIEARS